MKREDCKPGKWYIVVTGIPPKPDKYTGPYDTKQAALKARDTTLAKDFGGDVWQCPEEKKKEDE